MDSPASLPARARDHFLATWPLYAALAVTVCFGGWTYLLAIEEITDTDGIIKTRWQQFMTGEPNTMGDTLAGFVGSLTLIWVVASVIQQSMELKAQRTEFAKMAQAQDKQVKALEAQTDFIKFEKGLREQMEADVMLDELLTDFINRSAKCYDLQFSQRLVGENGEECFGGGYYFFDDLSNTGDKEKFLSSAYELALENYKVFLQSEGARIDRRDGIHLDRLIEIIDEICEISQKVSLGRRAQLQRYQILNLGYVARSIRADTRLFPPGSANP